MIAAPEIPSDVMAAAREAAAALLGGYDHPAHNRKVIARAILAERERCMNSGLVAGLSELQSEDHGSFSRAIGAFRARTAIQGPTT